MVKKFFKETVSKILATEAGLVLNKYRPKIIAITGSVGKTSTKDAVFSVLSEKFHVRKSDKSFNSEIGVPLTILGCPNAWNNVFGWAKNIIDGALLFFGNHHNYPQWLVLEIGADRPGDIKNICKWLKPDMVVVTRFAPVPAHVEFFGTPEAVIREKSELVKALKSDGKLFLSSDDDDVMRLKELVRIEPTTFGILGGAQVKGTGIKITYGKAGRRNAPIGLEFTVESKGQSADVKIAGTVGRHAVNSLLAAIAVGEAMGLSLPEMAATVSSHAAPNGRMKLIAGLKDTTIIDDTYNSSPVASAEALETLKSIKTSGRKIAVLGDMMELGKYSINEHRALGKAAVFADMLFTVGVRARGIALGALEAGMSEQNIIQFDKSEDAGKQLEFMIKPGDVILVKGSQAVRMEKTVEEIMKEPERKRELLVRQDEEWQKR